MDNAKTIAHARPDVLAAGVMIAFLRLGKPIDHASSALLLGTFLLQISVSSSLAVAALAAAFFMALAEKYYAWRVALDVDLFTLLQQFPGEDARFDAALATCLARQETMPSRSLASRWDGARRLLKRQLMVFVLQLACVATAFLQMLIHGYT